MRLLKLNRFCSVNTHHAPTYSYLKHAQVCTGQIYPTELELNKTTGSHDSCSYQDSNAKVLNIKFCVDSYEKRDTLAFQYTQYRHMHAELLFHSLIVEYLFNNLLIKTDPSINSKS